MPAGRECRAVAWWMRVLRFGAPVVSVTAALLVVLSGCASDVSPRQLAEEYFNLGNAYYQLGDYGRSFEYYSRAVAISDDIPPVGYNLARLHEQRGEYTRAAEVLEGLLEDDPQNGLYRETYAFVLYRGGREEDARALYDELVREYPARIRIRFNLGTLELAADRPYRAFSVLRDGVAYAEEDSEYRWILAEAAQRSGDEGYAQAELEVYRALSADDPEGLAALAKRQAEWGYVLAAIEVLEEIPETVSADPDLLFLVGSLYLRETEEFDRGAEAVVDAVRGGYDPEAEDLQALLDELPDDERAILQERIDAAIPAEDPEPDGGDEGGQ